LTGATNRKDSDIRIYCDDDAAGPGGRWQLVPSIELTPKAIKKMTDAKKETLPWWDPEDQIYRPIGSKGCKDAGTMAITYKANDPKAEGQKLTRESITVNIVNLVFMWMFPLTFFFRFVTRLFLLNQNSNLS